MTNQNDYSIIKEVLDKYFSFMIELGEGSLSALTTKIREVMLDKSKKSNRDWSSWLPLDSTISDNDILELEKMFKHDLPDSFKYFLKQKDFVELELGQGASFFKVLPNELVKTYKKIIDTFFWTLIDRNYLPFAKYSDWGVLCFNANLPSPDNDYSVVILDHDDNYQTQEILANNFLSMFQLFDKDLNEMIMQIRNHKKNNA